MVANVNDISDALKRQLQKPKMIRDRVHGNIPYSFIEKLILSSRIYNRLHYLYQNTLAFFVYPCNKTSRFEHSIGVMHLSSKMFVNAILNTDDYVLKDYVNSLHTEISRIVSEDCFIESFKDIFEHGQISSIVSRIYDDLHELQEKLKAEKLYKTIVEKYLYPIIAYDSTINSLIPIHHLKIRDKTKRVTVLIALQALRLSAMLHDIGHLPGCHIMEFVLENIYDNYESNPEGFKHYKPIIEILNKLGYLSDIAKIHERITKNLVDSVFSEIAERLKEKFNDDDLAKLLVYLAILRYLVNIILNCSYSQSDSEDDFTALRVLSKIISGDIDADRMDFVLRDGSSSGLLNDSADLDRIMKSAEIVKIEETESDIPIMVTKTTTTTKTAKKSSKNTYTYFDIVFDIKSLNELDRLLIGRYVIYRYLVCHHKVAKLDYLLSKAIELLIDTELRTLKGKSLISKFDKLVPESILQLLVALNKLAQGDYKEILKTVYRLSPLTDHWLHTLLWQKYFKLLVHKNERNLELLFILDEILTASNNLKSLWKRECDYFDFVKHMLQNMSNDDKLRKKFLDIIKKAEDELNKYKQKIDTIKQQINAIKSNPKNNIKMVDNIEIELMGLEKISTKLKSNIETIKECITSSKTNVNIIREFIRAVNKLLREVEGTRRFATCIEDKLNKKIKTKRIKIIGIEDVEVRGKIYCCPIIDKLKTGISKDLRIIGAERSVLLEFRRISYETYKFLDDKISFAMPINIYYPEGYIDNDQTESDYKIVQSKLIEIFPECLDNVISRRLKYLKQMVDDISKKLHKIN